MLEAAGCPVPGRDELLARAPDDARGRRLAAVRPARPPRHRSSPRPRRRRPTRPSTTRASRSSSSRPPTRSASGTGQHVVSPDEADGPDQRVAAVVIGDAGDDLSFRNLDIAFRQVRAGAAFVAMHRNPWWVTPEGDHPRLGRPGRRAGARARPTRDRRPGSRRRSSSARRFRELAAEVRRGGPAPPRSDDVAMVGDDLDSDVAGARRAGLRGILVLTGKTNRPRPRGSTEPPGSSTGPRRPDGVGADLLEVVTALLEGRG